MADNAQNTTHSHIDLVCPKCQSIEVRRLQKEALEKIFSLQRFQCKRCKHRQRRFQFRWIILARLAAATLLIAAVYVVSSLPLLGNRSVSAASEADSLAQARSAVGGQVSTLEQMMRRKPKTSLDNDQILSLWHAKVGTGVILQMIRTSDGNYDVRTSAVIGLRAQEVDQSIILAMIDANYSAR